MFKITSEASVAAGVRRIEAATGKAVLDMIAEQQKLIAETASELRTQNPSDIAKRASQLQAELHTMKKEIDTLNSKLASTKLSSILSSAVDVGSVKLVCAQLDDMQVDAARNLADDIKANNPAVVAVIALTNGGKLNFIAAAGKDAVASGAHAGKLVGAVAAVTGGKGGGRPDSAMAGGADASKIADALASAKDILAGQLK